VEVHQHINLLKTKKMNKNKSLSINQKLVATSVLIPFIADILEDLLDNTTIRGDIFDKHMVNNSRTLMKKFRKTDNALMSSAILEEINQQSEIYIALKLWLIDNLNVE
jgi:hypothetical protein